MEFQSAAVNVRKYATSESGDTIEAVERPHGGLSFVVADGQRSGRSAKLISNLVARKAISLLGEGVHAGVAGRAAHDYLRTHRAGQVSATLTIVSLDLVSRTLVISRNGPPVLLFEPQGGRVLNGSCEPIGIHPGTKPMIVEVPLQLGLRAVAFSDGLLDAGVRYGEAQPAEAWLDLVAGWGPLEAEEMANRLLDRALELDRGRPGDDISILVVGVYPDEDARGARRLSMSVPL
ncbi:MAG TPA: PP2C family protein-serine/threonine phosphatase [Anaerolineae bacterium]|nr:PP2C family protein-serine/threonine phosphatase [Anaerolineae bacterium]